MIILKSLQEIEKIRKACLVVADALEGLREVVRPGVTTRALDEYAEKFIIAAGAIPAFKGYRGYPCSICSSLNDQVVHGIPSREIVLREGDIISIDVGAVLEGFYGDAAVTLPVGRISPESERLIRVTEESLNRAIEAARPGNRLFDISHAVQSHVEGQGFSVVRDFVGHGIGRNLHEEPQIPNFGPPGRGPSIREGMVLAIEPMVNAGESATVIKEDSWTAVTADGSLSAHFEHTVAVMADGPWILTKR
ncbi:MAG: type I methionyl aminopeptidase [Nitrospirae bacterium GWC2_57_13]|jgi:methionyl aminopeptidase|nr:MAG: type I methionyl aminopeptidase [Nitrospirae bacterium GWC1_57_7]OGW28842.1 MAG: type I methionyl aminopeptidase [Nitrospirae bacterium GWC2_57_13]OGW42058.1 MAG: type I methionyl aminopeptidase [Nitrospirae bacterium GWD2_57_8]HAR46714.1 type I methionyl aminopeptidase [Nitrospiraceae bacterium]